MLPLDFETDREMLDAALPTIGLAEPPDAKLLWIDNTLDLAEVECSAAYLDEARARPRPGDSHASRASCRSTRRATCRRACTSLRSWRRGERRCVAAC